MPTPEHPPASELTHELVRAYGARFIARTDQYPRQLPQGHYISVKKPLTLEHIRAHLTGKMTLGAYALDENSRARWLCLDADTSDQWERLLQLAEALQYQAVTAYLEQSRRGGHGWLFTAPLPGRTVRRFGKGLLAKHDLEDVELYPKQDVLKTGPGSLVRLPLGIHRKTNRRYHFIQLNGQPLVPTIRQQVALLAHPTLVPPAFIEQVLADSPAVPPSPRPQVFAKVPVQSGEHLSERIKGSISVYEFVSRYVVLDGLGRGFCPFHDDTHQSFGVNAEENYWHCWAGCGGGSVIDFWMLWRAKHGQDAGFVATITALAQMLF